MQPVYKICPETLWRQAEAAGRFEGAPVDRADGYIHFSTAAQLRETGARHFAGQDGLVLVTVDAAALGGALRFEPSRGGDLFPHLYATLPLAAVRKVEPLPRAADGTLLFPADIP
jgi:uncharacterized protein (DUF952 family)